MHAISVWMADLNMGVRTECGFETICRGMLVVPQQGSSGAPPRLAEGAPGSERFAAGVRKDGAGHAGDSGDAAPPRGGRGDSRGGRHKGSESSPDTS